MSDFLGRLAARQLGHVLPVVSPRLPLRFAPTVEQPPDEPLWPAAVSSAESPAAEAITTQPSPLVAPAAADAPPPTLQVDGRGRALQVGPASRPLAEVSPPVATPRAAPDAHRRHPRRAIPVPPKLPKLQSGAPGPPQVTVVVAPPAPPDGPPEDEAASRPAADMASRPLVVPPRRAVPLVDAVPIADTPAHRPLANPPTVTVTIGRLEVRAVPASPATERKAAPASAAMSLETYLERRQAQRR